MTKYSIELECSNCGEVNDYDIKLKTKLKDSIPKLECAYCEVVGMLDYPKKEYSEEE